MENIPSYLDFFLKIKAYFKDAMEYLEDTDIDRYFGTEEAVFEISTRYSKYVERLQKNDATIEQMMIGGASSVANCLSLMYE